MDVMERYCEGADIESAYILVNIKTPYWVHDRDPAWNWKEFNYRVHSTPKFVPWTTNQIPVGKIVRPKNSEEKSLIIAAVAGHAYLGNSMTPCTAVMLSDYVMDDGSPCGTESNL